MHISLAPTEGRRLRSASDLSNVMRTPGAHPLGAPAMTPAVPLPSGNTTPSRNSATTTPVHHKLSLIKESALTPIPASPTTATTPAATVVRTPSVAGKEPSDYFASGKTRARSGSVTNDHAAEEHQDPAATPGGRFMGRLRNFGKSSKRPSSADATAVPAIQEDEDKDAAGANVDDGATSSVRAVSSLFSYEGCKLTGNLVVTSQSLKRNPLSTTHTNTRPRSPAHPPSTRRSCNDIGRNTRRQRVDGRILVSCFDYAR